MTEPIAFLLDGREVDGASGRDHLAGRAAPRDHDPASLPPAGARLPAGRQLPRLHGRDRGRAGARRLLHPQAVRGDEGEDRTPSARRRSRSLVFELLARRPAGARRRARSEFELLERGRTRWACSRSRFPAAARATKTTDFSHPAMAVHLDACIQCNLCVRACREVQVNDVIGMAARGHREKIVFDFDDPMGASTCVACGECVQACPTGALMPTTLVDEKGALRGRARPRGRQRLPLLRRRLPAHLPDQGRQASSPWTAATARRTRTGCASKAASASTTCTIRDRLTKPLIRKDGVSKHDAAIDPSNPLTHFREASWDEALDRAASGLRAHPRPRRRRARSPASARPRARTRKPICSRSWCAPASAPTMSITARGCATPPPSRRCWKASARARCRRRSWPPRTPT